MNRRTVLKNVLLISAGSALLPGCVSQDKPLMTLKNLSLTGSQEKMMADLAAAIIPASKDFIGAADVNAHEFTLMMIDDCEPPETQQKFLDGMKQFDKLAQDKYGKGFSDLALAQQRELLAMLEKKEAAPEAVQNFYNTTKRYTVQAFTSSEKYMKDIRGYKMVPGSNFKGCVPVT